MNDPKGKNLICMLQARLIIWGFPKSSCWKIQTAYFHNSTNITYKNKHHTGKSSMIPIYGCLSLNLDKYYVTPIQKKISSGKKPCR